MKKISLYELSVIAFLLLIPIIGSIIEIFVLKSDLKTGGLMLKWFVFSGVGLRLFTAGLKQAGNPGFTAKEIFKLNDDSSLPIVREIGLANISFGVIGLLSFFLPEFRLAAAVSGGLYFGLAGFAHLFRNEKRKKEQLAMISDLFIFAVLLVLIFISYI